MAIVPSVYTDVLTVTVTIGHSKDQAVRFDILGCYKASLSALKKGADLFTRMAGVNILCEILLLSVLIVRPPLT